MADCPRSMGHSSRDEEEEEKRKQAENLGFFRRVCFLLITVILGVYMKRRTASKADLPCQFNRMST